MAPFILFGILFMCGLINSYLFFPKSKLLAWLCSLLPIASLLPKSEAKVAKKEEKKNEEGLVVVDNYRGLETIFATFDKDGDGFITTQELEESLRRLGLFTTSKEVASMMEKVDANGDDLIDLEEFRKLYDSTIGKTGELDRQGDGDGSVTSMKDEDDDDDEMDLREAFNVFDGNRDGSITIDELGLVLKSLGLKQGMKEENLREMIREVDLDGDGMVNFEEFKKMMVKGGKLF